MFKQTTLVIIALLMVMSSSFANEKVALCSIFHANSVKAKLIQNNNNDKYKHCAVSCMLALRCGAIDSLNIGILKEVWDMFTPGDADIKDIKADMIGIEFYLNKMAVSDKECNQRCIEYDWKKFKLENL